MLESKSSGVGTVTTAGIPGHAPAVSLVAGLSSLQPPLTILLESISEDD